MDEKKEEKTEPMKPLELQNHIATLIARAANMGLDKAHLCMVNEELHVEPVNHLRIPHPVFMVFEAEHLRHGLTTTEWDGITRKILLIQERGLKCEASNEP